MGRTRRRRVVLHQVIGPNVTHDNITMGEGVPTLVEYLTPAVHEAMDVHSADLPEATNGTGTVQGSRA